MLIWKIPHTDKEFKTPNRWEDITVKKYAEYQTLVKQLQKDFIKTFNLKDESEVEKVTNAEILTLFPDYFIRLLCFWSNLTRTEALTLNKNDVFACFQHINQLIAANTTDKKLTSFEFKGVKYLFPQNVKSIDGNDALMGKESFGNMIEAFQQEQNLEKLNKGKFDVIANQMAILCRPEGEKQDPAKTAERAKVFQGLSMDIVWQFVFFSIRQTSKFKMLSQIYLKEGEAVTKD